MFAMNMTRQRERDQNAKQSKRAMREAYERKLQRQVAKENAAAENCEDLYDVCDETKGSVTNVKAANVSTKTKTTDNAKKPVEKKTSVPKDDSKPKKK